MPSSILITPEQQRLLNRMQTQRQRLLVRYIQHQHERQQRRALPLGASLRSSPLVNQSIRLVRQYPLATVALVGVAWAAGPKRLSRWTELLLSLLPLLLRRRV